MNEAGNIFLHQPQDLSLLVPTGPAGELVRQADAALAALFGPGLPAAVRNTLLRDEAASSSAIEQEHSPRAIRLHHGALLKFTRQPLTETSLLQSHRTIMAGLPHAQPGAYRSVNVTVGGYSPPRWEQVPLLMQEFFNLTGADAPGRTAHAAWAHIQFETIHPFADGNGRTGRAVATKLLDAPIPLSNFILANRAEYYRLLSEAQWQPYLAWFAQGVIEQCGHIAAQ